MTTTAPLPPDLSDPAGRDIEDAVIKAAKLRARRRRVVYAVAGVTAAVSVATFLTLGATRPSPNAPPAGPVVSGPPIGGGPIEEARLVAHLRAIHVGWVLVYSDGRVISSPDTDSLWERRLTAHGLDLVRSGSAPLTTLLGKEKAPPDTWAEPTVRAYGTPLGYVACVRQPDGYMPRAVTEALRELPTAARSLLAGTSRTYRVLDNPDVSRHSCFELTTTQAHALVRLAPFSHRALYAERCRVHVGPRGRGLHRPHPGATRQGARCLLRLRIGGQGSAWYPTTASLS